MILLNRRMEGSHLLVVRERGCGGEKQGGQVSRREGGKGEGKEKGEEVRPQVGRRKAERQREHFNIYL